MSGSAALLTFSGLVVLLLGFLCGAPLGRAINRGDNEEGVRAWRVAHSGLVAGGVMLLAIAPNLASVDLPDLWKIAASSMLGLSTWLFTFALMFGAWKGYRGLAPGSGPGSLAVYSANIAGVVLSTASVLLLAYGAAAHLLHVALRD